MPEQVPDSNDPLLHMATTGTFEQAYVVTASRFVANRIIAKAEEEGFAKVSRSVVSASVQLIATACMS